MSQKNPRASLAVLLGAARMTDPPSFGDRGSLPRDVVGDLLRRR